MKARSVAFWSSVLPLTLIAAPFGQVYMLTALSGQVVGCIVMLIMDKWEKKNETD